jgi:hypothetical protein
MSYSYYMLLYTACYNYCVNNKQHEISGYGSVPVGSSGTVKGEFNVVFQSMFSNQHQSEESADIKVCSMGMYSRSAFDGKRSVQQIERLSEDPFGQATDRESIEFLLAPFLVTQKLTLHGTSNQPLSCRNPKTYPTSPCCNSTRKNGNGTRREPTMSTGCLRT